MVGTNAGGAGIVFAADRSLSQKMMPLVISLIGTLAATQGSRGLTSPALRGCRANVKASSDYDFAILFDCDGVLAETERDMHRPSFNEAFKEKGIDCNWDVERYGVLLETGGGKERMKRHWDEVGWPSGFEAADEDTRWNLCKDLHALKTEIFMARVLGDDVPYRPRVLATIDDAIVHGIPVGVCSTSNEKAVKAIVSKMGEKRANYIRVFAGDVVTNKKPAPDVYILAAKEMGLNPNRCVVVEDTNIGLRAAKAAQMGCIVTKSIYTQNEDFAAADRVFNDLSFTDLDVMQEIADATHARFMYGVA